MPSGEEMRVGRPAAEFEALYMEPRALAFIRAWPDVPEVLRPVYSRFYDAGLIFIDERAPKDAPYPGRLRLTALGHRIREVMIGKYINFFRLVDVFSFVQAKALADQEPKTAKFLALWKMGGEYLTWDKPDFKRYVQLRLTGVNLMKDRGFRDCLDDLKRAMERLEFYVGMDAWRRGDADDLENDIPF